MSRYQPTVTIRGVTLPCDFPATGGGAVALDDLHITWGRDSIFEPTNPSELRVDIIDPDGQYGSDPTLFGAPITVQTELGMLFRGTIDGISMEPDWIDDPNPSIPHDVWRVSLSATDIIAKLARIVAPGYGDGSISPAVVADKYRSKYGPGWWDAVSTGTRVTQIRDRMAERGIATTLDTTDRNTAVPPDGRTAAQYFREPIVRSGADLYSMVQSVQLRGNQPLYTVYFPGPDVLDAARWAHASSLILTYAASVIDAVADPASGTTYTVDCTKISVGGSGAVQSTVSHNIAGVRVLEFAYWAEPFVDTGVNTTVQNWADGTAETPVSGSGDGTAQYEPPVTIGNWAVPYSGTGGVAIQSQTGAEFGAQLAPYIAALNGKVIPPDFIFDIENENYGAEVDAVLLATWPATNPWLFPGSAYERLIGFGPFFQAIGGELSFRTGWEVTVRFAASVSTGSGLTISELVTTDPPLLNQYAPAVTLTTLGIVTRGI